MHALNFSSLPVDCTNVIPPIYIMHLSCHRLRYSEKFIVFQILMQVLSFVLTGKNEFE